MRKYPHELQPGQFVRWRGERCRVVRVIVLEWVEWRAAERGDPWPHSRPTLLVLSAPGRVLVERFGTNARRLLVVPAPGHQPVCGDCGDPWPCDSAGKSEPQSGATVIHMTGRNR